MDYNYFFSYCVIWTIGKYPHPTPPGAKVFQTCHLLDTADRIRSSTTTRCSWRPKERLCANSKLHRMRAQGHANGF